MIRLIILDAGRVHAFEYEADEQPGDYETEKHRAEEMLAERGPDAAGVERLIPPHDIDGLLERADVEEVGRFAHEYEDPENLAVWALLELARRRSKPCHGDVLVRLANGGDA
jgi:hypothetical protein